MHRAVTSAAAPRVRRKRRLGVWEIKKAGQIPTAYSTAATPAPLSATITNRAHALGTLLTVAESRLFFVFTQTAFTIPRRGGLFRRSALVDCCAFKPDSLR